MEPEKLPEEFVQLFCAHHSEKYDCTLCDNSCCFQSGFAVLENVRLIYHLYTEGKLVREGFEFEPGLEFSGFVGTYFDAVPINGIIAYFPRHLAHEDSLPLRLPPKPDTNYYTYRAEILGNPFEDCRGCVFLESSMSHKDRRARRCILHDESRADYNYAKPIDCRFLTCSTSRRVKPPLPSLEQRYFELLRKHYGNHETALLPK